MKRTEATGSIDGMYIDRNTDLGYEGTKLTAEDRNAIQEEIVAVIEASGQTPSGSDLGQLLKSIVLKLGSVAETITGVKTFSSIPVLPASNPSTDNQATRKAYVDGLDAQNVKKTGDQTITGVKTFGSIPVGPASNPTSDNQLARKAYVDSKVGAVNRDSLGLATDDDVTFQTVNTGYGANEVYRHTRNFSNQTGSGDKIYFVPSMVVGEIKHVGIRYINNDNNNAYDFGIKLPSGGTYVISEIMGRSDGDLYRMLEQQLSGGTEILDSVSSNGTYYYINATIWRLS